MIFIWQTYSNPLQDNPAYSVVKWVTFSIDFCYEINFACFFLGNDLVRIDDSNWDICVLPFARQYFVNVDDTVAQKVSFFIGLILLPPKKDYFYDFWGKKRIEHYAINDVLDFVLCS